MCGVTSPDTSDAAERASLFRAMTLDELVSLKNLNESFYRCSVISHWKESTQRYRMNLLLNNLTLREEVLNGTYRVGDTIDFTLS